MKSTGAVKVSVFGIIAGVFVLAAAGTQAMAQVGAWEALAPMPTARSGVVAGVIGDKIYVAGGWDGSRSLDTLEVYDPATNSWSTKAAMPAARDGAGGGVIDGKLYVAGGDVAQNQKVNTLYMYDPATDTWATKSVMSTSRSAPGAAAIDGKLYVAGGCVGWCAPVTSALEVYDPATNAWTSKTAMPMGRGNTDVAVVNGQFYVMGGCCGYTGTQTDLMTRTIEVYEPATNAWATKAQHLVGAADSAGAISGKIYIAKFGATEIYDPVSDTWDTLPTMPTPRNYTTGVVMGGRFYVVGGQAGTVASAALEAYTPFLTPAPDYYPLAVGNLWIYSPSFGANGNRVDTIAGEEIVNGVRTFVWNRQEAPDDNYNEKRWLTKEAGGVKVHKFWSNEGPDPAVTIDPPWLVYKANPAVGETFVGSFEPASGTTYTVTATIESVSETVTVPVGTFRDCIRIRLLDEMTQNSVTTAVGWHKEWFAPNVGRVVYAKYDTGWANATTTQQLIGFSVTRGLAGDATGDGKLGVDDAVYTLQVVSGARN